MTIILFHFLFTLIIYIYVIIYILKKSHICDFLDIYIY